MGTLEAAHRGSRNFLGTLLQLLLFGDTPALDKLGRPLFAYGRTIHEHCPRRPHFDAGRFAEAFGDEGHGAGYCLYKLGCKGPATHVNCSTTHFCEVDGAWPIGIGHPCVGCTEREIAFRVPLFETIQHGLYRGFVAPAILYAALATVMWRNRGEDEEPEP